MDHKMYSFFQPVYSFLLYFALILCCSGVVQAHDIDSVNKYAWNENTGWFNFKSTAVSAVVYDDHLEGYIWAENIGFVRLGTYSGGGTYTYLNNSNADYGVNNDGAGNLSGLAWSENVGWLNFNTTYSQVVVDTATGEFDGYAWAENVGYIHFKNISPDYMVQYSFTKEKRFPWILFIPHARVNSSGIK